MSAYVVDRECIDTLVTGLNAFGFITDGACDATGRMLWAECLASVAYRYPQDGDGERPGPIDFRDGDVDTYTFTPSAAGLSPEQLRDSISEYNYQSCEHPGWESSTASAVLELLLAHSEVSAS